MPARGLRFYRLDYCAGFVYLAPMHELSLATELMSIIRDELAKHGAARLLSVRVRYGALSNVVPEALEMAFESLTINTDYAGAALEMVEDPLVLVCGGCGIDFTSDAPTPHAMCPHCGHNFFHTVKSGKELYLDHLEAE